MDKSKINVELIFPLPQEQCLFEVSVDVNTTISHAIEVSGILEKYPEIDLTVNKVGIFSKVANLEQTLRDGDRVEIYRPLLADPKEMRKRKAALKK